MIPSRMSIGTFLVLGIGFMTYQVLLRNYLLDNPELFKAIELIVLVAIANYALAVSICLSSGIRPLNLILLSILTLIELVAISIGFIFWVDAVSQNQAFTDLLWNQVGIFRAVLNQGYVFFLMFGPSFLLASSFGYMVGAKRETGRSER